ncbi:hypothetical protein KM043_015508 [Ampulex compressa]|nr:hypothetical protein KM043_015508 [Ampulex compressa]
MEFLSSGSPLGDSSTGMRPERGWPSMEHRRARPRGNIGSRTVPEKDEGQGEGKSRQTRRECHQTPLCPYSSHGEKYVGNLPKERVKSVHTPEEDDSTLHRGTIPLEIGRNCLSG